MTLAPPAARSSPSSVIPHRASSDPAYRAAPWIAVARFWVKSVDFTGRASRSELLWALLFIGLAWSTMLWRATAVITALNATAVCGISYGCAPVTTLPAYRDYTTTAALIVILGLILLLPTSAVMVRRLHDTNLSGHFLWLALLPGIGVIALVVLGLRPTQPGGARFDRTPPIG
jgi:uncharacterized membrane protein YhaH (DUF805 family)